MSKFDELVKLRAQTKAREKSEAARSKWLRSQVKHGDDHPETQKAQAAFERSKTKARSLPQGGGAELSKPTPRGSSDLEHAERSVTPGQLAEKTKAENARIKAGLSDAQRAEIERINRAARGEGATPERAQQQAVSDHSAAMMKARHGGSPEERAQGTADAARLKKEISAAHGPGGEPERQFQKAHQAGQAVKRSDFYPKVTDPTEKEQRAQLSRLKASRESKDPRDVGLDLETGEPSPVHDPEGFKAYHEGAHEAAERRGQKVTSGVPHPAKDPEGFKAYAEGRSSKLKLADLAKEHAELSKAGATWSGGGATAEQQARFKEVSKELKLRGHNTLGSMEKALAEGRELGDKKAHKSRAGMDSKAAGAEKEKGTEETGERGGRYILTASGKKRYIGRKG